MSITAHQGTFSSQSNVKPRTGRRRPGRRVKAGIAALLASGLALSMTSPAAASDVVPLGAGGYTTAAVGPLPQGCGDLATNPRQFLTEDAPQGPIPTNDWWSSLVFKKFNCQYSEPLHAHPASYLPGADGLGISYTTTPTISGAAGGVGEYHYMYAEDLVAGVVGLDAGVVKVADWSDWTVTPSWSDGTRTLTATIGHGLPITSFRTTGGDALLTTTGAPDVWLDDGAQVGFTVNGHDYVAYAPPSADWSVSGGAIRSDLAGDDFFAVAVLPTSPDDTDATRLALAGSYGEHAYAEVVGTTVGYDYDEAASDVTVTYAYETAAVYEAQEGTVVALYPHQAQNLTGATVGAERYVSPRGPMPVLVGAESFTTTTTYTGVLPEVPAVATGSGAGLDQLDGYLDEVASNPVLVLNNDTYWTGKGLGRAARIAEIADQVGRTDVRDTALDQMRGVLTDWLSVEEGESEQVFAYNETWGTLVGSPGSYGSDTELNDHHFHYGYFIAAAATLAKFDPEWASDGQYGAMVDLLIRDANGYDRSDTMFPYLRDFDIYAGHDWASGHGAFWAGNNQESSSEGQNFAGALIQWGDATGNDAVRDAGVYLWTTQASAIQNYWFDESGEAFPEDFPHTTVGMVWGDGGSYSTWFSADPEKIQGINMLPLTGNHLYLGTRPEYVLENYGEVVANGGEPDVWQDILWGFLALGDGEAALAKLQAGAGYVVEEGESRAHTYHWIANLAALGNVDPTVTGNHVLSSVFVKDGERTYVAANTSKAPLTVTFSDGTDLTVGPGKTATSGAHTWSGGSAVGTDPTDPPTEEPTDPPTEEPTDPPTEEPTDPPTEEPTEEPTDPPTDGFDGTLYLGAQGALSPVAGPGGAVEVTAANGNFNQVPHAALTFEATGLDATYEPGATAFDLAVDSGPRVANAVQLRVSVDLTGDGTWDRVETYRYAATDPIVGYERYTQAHGLASSSGSFGDLDGGTVRVEVWSAIGSSPSTIGLGAESVVMLPFGG